MIFSDNRKSAIKKLKNLFFSLKAEVKDYREKMDLTFENPILPNNVEYTERSYGGVACDVLSPEIYNTKRVILYIHGGCFVGGSRKSYRPFVAALAAAVSSRAIVPDFRLAPTHAYPAALDDVQAVFRTLYTEELVANSLDNSKDIDNSRPQIIVMADGSGASIALGLVLSLRDRFRLAVNKVILFSPWLDVSVDSKKFNEKKAGDELYSAEAMKRSAELYTFQDNRNIPLISALKATKEQLAGFPEVYIQMGSKEFLLDDAKSFKNLLVEAGNECTLDIWKNMPSMFQLADEYLEESHLAVERIGKLFTARNVDESDSQTQIQLTLEKKERISEENKWN